VAIIEDSDDDEGEIESRQQSGFKVKGMEATQEGVILRLDDEKEIASISRQDDDGRVYMMTLLHS